MAFQDDDIASHMRSLHLDRPAIQAYDRFDGKPDPLSPGMGLLGWKAKQRIKRERELTLADVRGKLKWTK